MIKELLTATTALICISACSMRDDLGIDSPDLVDSTGSIIDSSGTNLGVVIISERSERIAFQNTKGPVTEIIGSNTIKLDDIRNEIAKENMSLPLFAVTNLTISSAPEFTDFIQANKQRQLVLTVSTRLPGEEFKTVVLTPENNKTFPIETLGGLLTKLELNKELFALKGSLGSFESSLKNTLLTEMEFQVSIRFLEPIELPQDFALKFSIEGSSKKAL